MRRHLPVAIALCLLPGGHLLAETDTLARTYVVQLLIKLGELEAQIEALQDEINQTASDPVSPQVITESQTLYEGPIISANTAINYVDPEVHTSTISGGGYFGSEQRIGWPYDPDYVAGAANVATISGGYDNINNQLAGTIAGGAHHRLYAAGDHGTISGGSFNSIWSGSYSTIAGGGGGSDPQSIFGERSVISGGGGNRVTGNLSAIAGGLRNEVAAEGSSIGGGVENVVRGRYAFAVGNRNEIDASAIGAVAAGQDVVASVPGSINISTRGDFGQSILFDLSCETYNDTPQQFLSIGFWQTPQIPAGAVWSGEAHIVGVNQSGSIVSLNLSFTANAAGVQAVTSEKLLDQIGLTAFPVTLTIANDDAQFLLTATGAAGETIRWNAATVVSQVMAQ